MYKKCYNSSLQCMDLYDTQNDSPDFSLGGRGGGRNISMASQNEFQDSWQKIANQHY